MFQFTKGMLVLVQGDKKDYWFLAKDWQHEEFIKAMQFGTMKSMGAPNPQTLTDKFKKNGFNYRFEVINDWGPVYLINLDTNKKRQIRYFNIPKTNDTDEYNYEINKPKITKI